MSWFCYMLECSDKSLYIGVAKDPVGRLRRHNWGVGARYTAKRRPAKLIWQEEHANELSARRRETELKAWRREKKLALIDRQAGSFAELGSGTARTILRARQQPSG